MIMTICSNEKFNELRKRQGEEMKGSRNEKQHFDEFKWF